MKRVGGGMQQVRSPWDSVTFRSCGLAFGFHDLRSRKTVWCAGCEKGSGASLGVWIDTMHHRLSSLAIFDGPTDSISDRTLSIGWQIDGCDGCGPTWTVK